MDKEHSSSPNDCQNIALHYADKSDKIQTELTNLKDCLNPIREWYGGGTEGNRPDIEILVDVVADLQADRKELLALQAENKRQAGLLVLAKEQMDAQAIENKRLKKAIEVYLKTVCSRCRSLITVPKF